MKRWQINLYTLWVTQIISLTSFGLGLPFIPFFIQELGVVEPDQIKLFTGLLSGAPAITMGIMAPIWGRLADKWGRKLMILRAMLSAAIIIGAMGMVTNVWQLLGLRVCQGFLTGTVGASTAFVAANTPKKRLAYALGFMSSSTFIGYSIGPFIGGMFAEQYGYRLSFYLGALLMIIGFFLVYFLIIEDKSTLGSKSEENLDNEHEADEKNVRIFTPLIVSLLAILLFQRVTRAVFSPYLPIFIQSSIEGSGAVRLTGIINGVVGISTALAGLTISRLGDRFDKKKLITILLIISIIVSIPLSFMNSIYAFIAVYGLMYFFLGGIEPIVTSLTALNTPAHKRGELFGYQSLVGSMGWVLSPMMGAFVSVNYGTESILYLLPVFMTINLLLVFRLRIKHKNE